ncbi:MAG: DHHA1 domain-containing protein [Desulfurococcaceae archaeon]
MVQAIIAHTDVDGIGAAALYLYLTGISEYRVFFTEPFLLHRALDKVASAYYEKVVILDLGINPSVYRDVLEYLSLLRKHNIDVSWYDHHLWANTWIHDLESIGVKLYIDESTCTVGVVANYTKPMRSSVDEDYVRELVNGICAGDLWRFDHWLGPYYIRLVRRRDKDSWRRRVLNLFVSGRYWAPEFEEKVVEHVERELEVFSSTLNLVEKSINGLKIVVASSSEKVENSFLAAYLLGRRSADMAILASGDGKLSFRSRGVNVREIALRLGGGGHVYASGAKISIPWWVKFFSRIHEKILLNYISELVNRVLRQNLLAADPRQ